MGIAIVQGYYSGIIIDLGNFDFCEILITNF